jgi:hypothetical protein
MKLFAAAVMCIALYFLYRIAFPKQVSTKKDNETPVEKPKSLPDVMGKSRFVLPDRSKPLQTPATLPETEKEVEKEPIFAGKTEEERSVAIPAEQFDEVFNDNSNPEIMSVPLEDDNEDEIDFEAEEAEELGRMLGREPVLAEGMDYDDLQTVVKVVKEQPNEVSEETVRTLTELENTDMFEMLASGSEAKMNWIKSIVARNVQNRMPETENIISDIDYGKFDVADILN